MMTPFLGVLGPNYVYILKEWVGSKLVPIYVGRGRGRRAKDYYKLSPTKGRPPRFSHNNIVDMTPYYFPETHNMELNKKISEIRLAGKEISIHPIDCGSSLSRAKYMEKYLISKFGRKDLKRGTLLNKSNGG